MLPQYFVVVGSLIQIFGSYSYFIDTIKGKVKPNKVSWLLWSIAPLIASVAQLQQGVGLLTLTTFVVGFVPLIIFIASFVNKEAYWGVGKLDIACGILSLIGLGLWVVTRIGNVAILFSIVADGLAAVPTIVKSYKHPESENDSIFWFGVINSVLGLLVITNWEFEFWGFPAYLLVINLLIASLIRFRLGKK